MAGPLCVSRLPKGFVDKGTNCLGRSPTPSPIGNPDRGSGPTVKIYQLRSSPPSKDAVVKAAAAFLMRDDVEGFRSHPYHPAAGSGITIGFGYDLKFHDEDQLRADWANLGTKALDRLAECCEQEGSVNKAGALKDITIRRDVAAKVAQESVARYYSMTLQVFPGVERLPPGVQVALTSVIFNRGNSEKVHTSWDRMTRWEKHGIMPWREMRWIQEDVRTGNLFDLYYDLQAMARVWSDTPIERAMKYRRRVEAEQILPYIRQYEEYQQVEREFPGAVDWRDYLEY